MEKYEFELLAWLNLSDREARLAAAWYKGAGWYFNQPGKPARLIAASDPPVYAAGQMDALNKCGAEGWSIGAWMTEPGPQLILQRRVGG